MQGTTGNPTLKIKSDFYNSPCKTKTNYSTFDSLYPQHYSILDKNTVIFKRQGDFVIFSAHLRDTLYKRIKRSVLSIFFLRYPVRPIKSAALYGVKQLSLSSMEIYAIVLLYSSLNWFSSFCPETSAPSELEFLILTKPCFSNFSLVFWVVLLSDHTWQFTQCLCRKFLICFLQNVNIKHTNNII